MNLPKHWRNGLRNQRGTIAMARLGGQPDSATSQFFINVVDNSSLDAAQRDGAAYAVFGTVVDGLGVVDTIRSVQTSSVASHRNVPVEPVIIEKMTRIEKPEAASE